MTIPKIFLKDFLKILSAATQRLYYSLYFSAALICEICGLCVPFFIRSLAQRIRPAFIPFIILFFP